MTHLTFKQYLESKEQLLKAIENTPITILEYNVRKYCSICIGESEEEKRLISLKPKNKIVVEWDYSDFLNPTPTSIRITGPNNMLNDEPVSTFWSGYKLNKWLLRNTNQGTEITHRA